MKKSLLVILFLFQVLSLKSAECLDLPEGCFPDYIGNDRNFLLCTARLECAFYIDKKSLVIQKYDPPIYTLAVNLVQVANDDAQLRDVKTIYFMYKLKPRSMFVLKDGSWHHLSAVYEYELIDNIDIELTRAGEMAFYIAYKMKFYGDRDWINSRTREIRKSVVDDDKIYLIVDGAK